MRITACRIEAFGPFRARVFNGLDYPVVVVQGPNEAGKTTLFHFFREMLYGLAPPDAARHPYTPEPDGQPLEGHLRYRLADGTYRTVHRRLLNTPQARLTGSGHEAAIDLQNRPLPAVAHVSREVFSTVYAMSGRALDDLQGTAWEEVQARVLHTMNAQDVRPTDDVLDDLEREARRYWSPSAFDIETDDDSEAAKLATRRRRLQQELKQAQAHDHKRRTLHEAIAEHTEQLEALEAERADLKAHLRRAERLRPVHVLVTKMEDHAERAGDLTPFEEVPEEPAPVLRRLEREIEQYEEELEQNERARDEAQATCDAFTREDRRIEREADSIRAWTQKASAHENRAEHREELLHDVEQLTSVLNERARRVFGEPWNDTLADALQELPADELEERVEAYREIDSEVEALEVRADTLARKVDRRKRLWPWLAAAAVGGLILVLGVVLARPLLWGPGGGLIVVGIVQAFNMWSYNRERSERLGELDLEIEEKSEVRDEKSAAIAELLEDLPLSEEEATHPDYQLWDALQEIRRQVEEREALRRQADALTETLEEAEASVTALAERCGMSSPEEAVPSETIARLERRLQVAETHHERADAAEARLAELRQRQHEIESALEERREHLDALTTKLHKLHDDPYAAVDELKVRRRAARRAEHVRETLFEEHPDWEALREEIRELEGKADTWTYSDEDIVRMQERREAVSEEILEVEKQRARKREEVEHLSRVSAPGDVASKLAGVQRRLEAAGRRYDRLTLLKEFVRRSARTFHLKNQPEVVKQAGRYLRMITGGRYHRLLLEGEERRLHVCQAEGGTPRPVTAPLSQGVRDQIHVALRMALLDHLDQSQEALPVFLDEVFTAWDRNRRQEGYAVIEELAERRQVFVFTCHPALSEELYRRLDAHRLLLEAPAGTSAAVTDTEGQTSSRQR